MRKELAETGMERDIVEGGGVLCAGVAAKYAVMKTLRLEYPVSILCRIFGVSCSGFYAWAAGKPSQRAQDETRLKMAIKAVQSELADAWCRCACNPNWRRKELPLAWPASSEYAASCFALLPEAQIQGHDELELRPAGGREFAEPNLRADAPERSLCH